MELEEQEIITNEVEKLSKKLGESLYEIQRLYKSNANLLTEYLENESFKLREKKIEEKICDEKNKLGLLILEKNDKSKISTQIFPNKPLETSFLEKNLILNEKSTIENLKQQNNEISNLKELRSKPIEGTRSYKPIPQTFNNSHKVSTQEQILDLINADEKK